MKLTTDKGLIISAIENYSVFSINQKQILKTLVNFENEVPADVILNVIKISKQAFQFSIKRLLDEEYIIRQKIKVFVYRINKPKMQQIVETYTIQQSLINK